MLTCPDAALGIPIVGSKEQKLLGSLTACTGGWDPFGVELGQDMKLAKKCWLIKSSEGLTSHLIQEPGILHAGQHFNWIETQV